MAAYPEETHVIVGVNTHKDTLAAALQRERDELISAAKADDRFFEAAAGAMLHHRQAAFRPYGTERWGIAPRTDDSSAGQRYIDAQPLPALFRCVRAELSPFLKQMATRCCDTAPPGRAGPAGQLSRKGDCR